jgi:hypothetical protein
VPVAPILSRGKERNKKKKIGKLRRKPEDKERKREACAVAPVCGIGLIGSSPRTEKTLLSFGLGKSNWNLLFKLNKLSKLLSKRTLLFVLSCC